MLTRVIFLHTIFERKEIMHRCGWRGKILYSCSQHPNIFSYFCAFYWQDSKSVSDQCWLVLLYADLYTGKPPSAPKIAAGSSITQRRGNSIFILHRLEEEEQHKLNNPLDSEWMLEHSVLLWIWCQTSSTVIQFWKCESSVFNTVTVSVQCCWHVVGGWRTGA